MALRGIVASVCMNRTKYIQCASSVRLITSKVPSQPTWIDIDPKDLPEVPELSDEMINHLERLSLVDFNNKEGVERLRSAILYANQLSVVNTDGIEPMYSVLEDRELMLRDDQVTEGGCKSSILQNAAKLDEDYFVAPPGNIPLTQSEKKFNEVDSDS